MIERGLMIKPSCAVIRCFDLGVERPQESVEPALRPTQPPDAYPAPNPCIVVSYSIAHSGASKLTFALRHCGSRASDMKQKRKPAVAWSALVRPGLFTHISPSSAGRPQL